MSQNSGTKVIAPIVTPSTLDTFPTHMANTGKGGCHTASTIAERDNIPPERREEGMLCVVVEGGVGVIYHLIGGLENTFWKELETGSSDTGSEDIDLSLIDISDIPYDVDNLDSKSVKDILDELLYIAPVITSFGVNPSVVEKGTEVNNLVLNWATNKEVTEQSINQGIGVLDKSVKTYTVTSSVKDNTAYALTVADGKTSVNKTASISFRNKLYYGVSTLETLTNDEILALNGDLATNKVKSLTFNPQSQYIYIAIPTSFGKPSFKVNGLSNDAWVVTTTNHTNSQNHSESYTIYRSSYIQNGSDILIEMS